MSWAAILRLTPFVAIALLIAGILTTRERLADQKLLTAQAERQRDLEEAAHKLTVGDYRRAAERAARMDAENVLRVRAEQDAVTERIVDGYEVSLADVRARAERLRIERDQAAARAGAGSGASATVHGISDAAARADASAGEDRFSAEDRLIATEQALQLNALIDWVEAQQRVPLNRGD